MTIIDLGIIAICVGGMGVVFGLIGIILYYTKPKYKQDIVSISFTPPVRKRMELVKKTNNISTDCELIGRALAFYDAGHMKND